MGEETGKRGRREGKLWGLDVNYMYVYKLKTIPRLGTVSHICNASTQEAEAGRWLRVYGQPELHSEFEALTRIRSTFKSLEEMI